MAGGRWKRFRLRGTLAENVWRLATDPASALIMMIALFLAECFVNVWVINNIKYTEIDWWAYMQEVGGVINGTYNYTQLRGDTGPLVYPAGFVYIFMGLYWLTDAGSNIRLAQYCFAALYLFNILLVFRIYRRLKLVPPYVFVFMCCASYRIHSIYVLRMFNDPIAMVFLFIAINYFIDDSWGQGCFFYSIGVSVKMNILLFAPGLLLLLLLRHGLLTTAGHLAICAFVQLLVAWPFLLVSPAAYLAGAFDVSRQFLYEWTVNWRLVPEGVFLSRRFHASLLALHIAVLVLFLVTRWRRIAGNRPVLRMSRSSVKISPHHVVSVLFTANFVGMCFSRSLHYQFYVWYFHTLPHLLWTTNLPVVLRLLVLGVIELAWNTYPSTTYSSLSLHACHALLLAAVWWGRPDPRRSVKRE